jgi:hypothetical protein
MVRYLGAKLKHFLIVTKFYNYFYSFVKRILYKKLKKMKNTPYYYIENAKYLERCG